MLTPTIPVTPPCPVTETAIPRNHPAQACCHPSLGEMTTLTPQKQHQDSLPRSSEFCSLSASARRRPRRSLIPTCDWTPPCQPEQELPQPCPDGSDLRGKWQLSCGIKWTSFNRQTIRSGLINWRAISIVVRNFKPQHCLSQALLSPRFCLLVEVTAVKLCVPSQDYTWSLN